MTTYEITLEGFSFPAQLDNSKANFRFIVDVRFIVGGSQFGTEHAVMPSLDTFWECDTKRGSAPNFVRAGVQDNWLDMLDMEKIDLWDRLVMRVTAEELHSLQVKVIDVNREDILDKLKGALQGVLEGALGRLRGHVAARIPKEIGGREVPVTVSQTLGTAADDVESFLLKKLAGGHDVLFRGSTEIPTGPGVFQIVGKGTRGEYQITFKAKKL